MKRLKCQVQVNNFDANLEIANLYLLGYNLKSPCTCTEMSRFIY